MKIGSWIPELDTLDVTGKVFSEDFAPKLSLLAEASAQSSCDLRYLCSGVENQRQLGSCVGNAVVGALELLLQLEGKPYMELSRLFVYYNARLGHSAQEKDEGTYISLAMESLSRVGVPSEEAWPYDTTKVFIRPSWKAYQQAYGHKINSYYRITATGENRIAEIESAIRAKHPVVFGVPVYPQIRSCTGHIELPQGESLGGHAMLLVAFNSETKQFIVRNSWGTSWGDQGYASIDYAYFDAVSGADFWVCTRLQ